MRKVPIKRTRTEKPKGVRWTNKEGVGPLRHTQYYFPKLYSQVSKRYIASLNKNQLETLKEQQPISELPYPDQTLRTFNREVLPILKEDETLTKKDIKAIREDYIQTYTEERTAELGRAPALLTILMDWVLMGKLNINKRTRHYKLSKKQELDLQSEDFSSEEISSALELLNSSLEAAEKRAKAAALFAAHPNSSEEISSISDPDFKKMIKRLHGKR